MRPGPRRSLTHAEILDAAFGLLEAKGFEAVSVRGVAGVLGLTPTAMYTYYPNKGALLAGMVEQVLGRLDTRGADAAAAASSNAGDAAGPGASAARARTRIVTLAEGLRSILVERPGAVGLLLATPLDGPNARRLDERLLGAFTDAGLDPVQAGRATHAVRVHVLGAVAFDAAEVERAAGAPVPADIEAAPAASATLWDDAETFPLGDRSRELADDPAARFAWGLERLLDGLLAHPASARS
ncbi:TetR/AcrR family transcriptional regulator [Agromyces bracchium]|uniref:TetR family transcriptional regulator n=1 Tax=Agromyces bracchium TaxID=88376 RepID=A0A6I3M3D1_9MICO|nr:TetR/AcrR family transcriptional regulator [Agromyces bracchium]MTH67939.1 TetR family transcriptional regulator [Agromyces bracchium]